MTARLILWKHFLACMSTTPLGAAGERLRDLARRHGGTIVQHHRVTADSDAGASIPRARTSRRVALVVVVAAVAIFAQTAGANVLSRAESSTHQNVEPPAPPTDPLQPPQGDVVVDQTGDRLVYQDPTSGQTTARVFGTQVAYLDSTGAWKPLDDTLHAAPTGGYANGSGPIHLNFAASGDAGQLVQLTDGDNSASFGLSGAVASKSTVSGTTITYPGAIPGADLRYELSAGELKETLVLSQPPAGNGSVSYTFPLDLHGLTPQTAKDGTVQFVDAQGHAVFSLPTGVAIDSATSDTDAAGIRSAVAVRLVGDAKSGWSIQVQPDANWLRSPDRVYPIYVDPSYTWTAGAGAGGSSGYDAYISSSAPNTNFDGAGQWNGTDYVDEASATTSTRSTDAYYDLSWLSGRSVSAATWYGYVTNGAAFPAGYQIQPLNGSWTETGVTWNTQPSTIAGASVTGSATAASTWASNSITSWVQNWAGGSWTNNGVVISHNGSGTNLRFAADESSSNLSYIQVAYDSYPTTPTMRQPAPSSSTNDVTPQLSARVKDPDGGTLHGDYEIWSASTGGTLLYSGGGSTTSSGDRSTWTTPTLTNGTTYWWDLRADDGSAQSAYTTRRSFTIDTTAPAAPGISSTTYTSGSWNSAASGAFTFTNGGSSDVVGYYYDFNNSDPTANNTTSGTPTISEPSGWHELDVRSYDAAGNLSPLATFTYGVTPGGVLGIAAGERTQNLVTFSADATTTYDGVALQYRRADDQSWTAVPASDVTYQSSGLGISTWPVTLSGSPRRTSVNLVWNSATTLSSVDGPVQVRASYYISGTPQSVYSGSQAFTLDTTAYGSHYATLPIGPGAVNPVTGNLTLQMSDASAGTLGFERSFNSRSPNTAGLFGPGWTSDLSTPYGSLTDNGATVTITSGDGSTMSFSLNSSGTAYLPNADAVGFSLTKPSSGRFQLSDPGRETTGFQVPSGGSVYVPFDVSTAATGLGAITISWQTSSGVEQPTKILAGTAPGVTCSTLSAGCRELLFNYATSTTATGTGSSQWGDYLNQLKTVKYKAWDTELGTPGFTVDTLATYRYDINGLLRSEWDPRITSPLLKTTYSYDANGEVSTVTPPGLNQWTFTYATISGDSNPGRLSKVQRATATAGTATTTVIYRVPISGSGAPYNLSSSETARWGQQDNPTDAAAIFPADEVPSSSPPTDYNRASIYYEDAGGRLVNTAQPSPASCATTSGDCNITTTEYNSFGETIRTLSADNRQSALNASSTDNPDDEALLASRIDNQTIYSSDGTELDDQYGPAHDVTQPAPNEDQIMTARQHTHYVYDQGAPTSANCPCHLATTVTETGSPTDGSTDIDTRTTTYTYNIGTDNTGWTLGKPLLTTVDPSGLDLVTTTLYDATTGLLIERRLPAGPSGGDAHATQFIHYTAGTNSQEASCGNKPEYALLLCEQKPAAQPGTSGLPDIPVTTHPSYNRYDLPLTITDTAGSDSRTTTYTYDSGYRQHTEAITSTVGSAVPTVTWNYDSNTGLQTTTSDGTRTITRTYAGDQTLSSYQDADGNTSTFTYNIDGLPATIYDGKATQTLTYDVGVDPRGMPTSITDSAVGTFSSTHDADGNLLTETYPGGLVASRTYDSTGTATHLDYSKSGTTWLSFDTLGSIHGRKSTDSSTLSTTDFSYDAAGRLTSASDTIGAAGCVTRQYVFDNDSNRTGTTTISPAPDGSCGTSGTTQTRTFDAADRATLSGYAYDALGNATTIPSADAPVGFTVTASYFVNDLIRTLAVGSDTRTFQLDPANRLRTWNDSVDGITRTNHYAVDGDSASWTTSDTAGTAWTRNVDGFGGLSAILTHPAAGSESTKLELTDLHGDIVATADPSGTTYDTPTLLTTEYGQAEPLSTTAQYTYLGADARSQDALTGMTLMGSRVYNPTAGRFEQTDPVLGGSANNYDYAAGDPVNQSDPSGLWVWHSTNYLVNCSGSCEFYVGIYETWHLNYWMNWFHYHGEVVALYLLDLELCGPGFAFCDFLFALGYAVLQLWVEIAASHHGCAFVHEWYVFDWQRGYSLPNYQCKWTY